MPLYLFYTMVQKSQKWPKTQIKGGGGPALTSRSLRRWKSWLMRFLSHDKRQLMGSQKD